MLTSGVQVYKRLKVKVGWTEIINGCVFGLVPSIRQLVRLVGGICTKNQISNAPNAKYIYKNQISNLPNAKCEKRTSIQCKYPMYKYPMQVSNL
jgi:hypothetical protein